MRPAAAYEVRNLRKIYRAPGGDVVANDGISFVVEPGTAFGLLGPNGAGKTTLVRQLVGLVTPSSGEVRLFGETMRPGPQVGRRVAYLPQSSLALGEFKVREALTWTAKLRGCGRATAGRESGELLERFELGEVADRQVRRLSGGQRRLTQIAMSLVGRLPVVILDEPTADIDPSLRARIWSLLGERTRSGASIVLVTHDVTEAERALDRVAILEQGRVVAHGTPAELKSGLAHRTRIEVVIAEGATVAAQEVAGLLGEGANVDRRMISAWVPADEAIPTLEKVMASAGAESFEDVHLVTPTLEDVYLAVAGHRFETEEKEGKTR